MYPTHEKHLAAYRQGNSEKRVYLFLSHPDLRNAFTAIDMAEYAAEKTQQPAMNRWRRFVEKLRCKSRRRHRLCGANLRMLCKKSNNNG